MTEGRKPAPSAESDPMNPQALIGLSGYAGSGKDTGAQQLVARGWQQRAFADRLRALALRLDPLMPDGRRYTEVLETLGYEKAKLVPGFREFLQDLGDGARRELGPDVWVNAALRCMGPNDRIVLSDVRYVNEAETIKDRSGIVVRIARPGTLPPNGHVSEHELADYDFDHVVVNDGTPAALGRMLAGIARMHFGTPRTLVEDDGRAS